MECCRYLVLNLIIIWSSLTQFLHISELFIYFYYCWDLIYNSKQSKRHFISSFDESEVLGLTVLYNSYIGLKQKAVKGIIYRLE